MSTRIILFLIVAFFSSMVYAGENKYDICFIKGYFSGEDDKFMFGLANQIAIDRGVIKEPICMSAHKEAYDVGVKFSTTGKYSSEQEFAIINYASVFRQEINRAVMKLIK